MIVTTKYGKLEGVSFDGCTVFKGVGYAKPPVGELRFRKPQKPESWSGVKKADKFGCRSMQGTNPRDTFYKKEFYSNPDFETPISEDCLYLNIWVPDNAEGGKLPVAVYVHGGAFLSGAGSNLPFVCSKLAKAGVIVVTINYRLGYLGFACHPLLGVEGENEAGGNYGLWDQLEALAWVKENIAAFGGDENNVTVFGQSAGAMSLQALAVSPKAEGLFDKMIMQSGGGYKNPLGSYRSIADASGFAEDLFESLGINAAECADSEGKRAEALNILHSVSSDEMMNAVNSALGKAFSQHKGMPAVPVIDGELIPGEGNGLVDSGNYCKVPYMLGANGDDLTAAQGERTPDNNPMHTANIVYAQKVETDAYVYYFDRKLPGDDAGAFHSGELWYVFGSLEYCWRPLEEADYELSDRMIRYWTNFMKYGNPNGTEGGAWRKCTSEDPYFEVLDVK